MIDRDTENRIIELRARGKSYASIASELRIAKQTTIDVCKKYKEQIATLQAMELEQLYEAQRITHTERITSIASLMRRVRGRDRRARPLRHPHREANRPLLKTSLSPEGRTYRA